MTIADGGYPGTGLVMPHRRRAGEELTEWKQEHNRSHKAGPGPRRARLRPHEDLEDPSRLPSQGRRRTPRHARHRPPTQPHPRGIGSCRTPKIIAGHPLGALKAFRALQAEERFALGERTRQLATCWFTRRGTPSRSSNFAGARIDLWHFLGFVVSGSTTLARRASPSWPTTACRTTSSRDGPGIRISRRPSGGTSNRMQRIFAQPPPHGMACTGARRIGRRELRGLRALPLAEP